MTQIPERYPTAQLRLFRTNTFDEDRLFRDDTEDRKIGLSKRRVDWSEEEEAAAAGDDDGGTESGAAPSKPRTDLKGGLGASGPLFGSSEAPAEEAEAAAEPADEAVEEAKPEPTAEATEEKTSEDNN